MKHNVYKATDHNLAYDSGPWKFENTPEGQLRALVKNVIDPEGEEIVSVVPYGSDLLVITRSA